jgi:DNA-directed RNA polymerase specialized sigma24 family protein
MIGRGGLEEDLRAVKRGARSSSRRLTFEEFARKTSDRWTQIAHLLHGRWDLPLWVSVEDIRQDLLLAAWRYAWYFDVSKSSRKSVEHFAVWNALHAAQKAATKARIGHRPHRGEGRDVQSCYEIPASSIARDGEDDRDISEMASTPATQEDVVLRRVFFERMAKRASGAEKIALCALAACGNADGAVSALYDDEDTRWLLQIGNEDDAVAIVRAVIERVSAA